MSSWYVVCNIYMYMCMYMHIVYIVHVHVCIYMYAQLLRRGNARQLRLRTTPLREKEELPQAGFEPATFCVLGRHSTN